MTDYPPGVLAVPIGSLTRYPTFWTSLVALERPEGCTLAITSGPSVAQNLNNAVRDFLLPNPALRWIWFGGDDHAFASDVLLRMLAHRVDVVSPVCAHRTNGGPLIFTRDEQGRHAQLAWADVPLHGLLPVECGSGAGLVVQRHVFEKLSWPWFEVGRLAPDELSEDLTFYYKLREAGFTFYTDLDTIMGHTTPAILWPDRTPEGWRVVLDIQRVV